MAQEVGDEVGDEVTRWCGQGHMDGTRTGGLPLLSRA